MHSACHYESVNRGRLRLACNHVAHPTTLADFGTKQSIDGILEEIRGRLGAIRFLYDAIHFSKCIC